MTGDSKLRALVVYAHYPERLSYFADWLDALIVEPALEVIPANLVTPLGRRRVRRGVSDADLIIVLHSAIGDSLSEIGQCETVLADRRGPLVAFIGNEVSLPSQPLRAKLELLRRLQPDVIGTQLLLDSAQTLYSEVPNARVVAMPHALNPAKFHPTSPNTNRPVDVGFRGGRYPASLGENDRDRIVEYFATTAFVPPLIKEIRLDASYGRRGWSAFLNRCKATVGAESGARSLRLELPAAEPGAAPPLRDRLRPVHRYLPRPLKTALRRGAHRLGTSSTGNSGQDAIASVPHAAADVLASGKCLSSRHFDAIGTETCQILFPGRYNDLLEADRHYLSLDRDFSNIDDVLARFHDESDRTRLVRETREWALETQTLTHRVRSLLTEVGAG